MKNTGVWTKCELDDEGNISLVVHAAVEWKDGETVTVGEIIIDLVPKELLEKLKSALNEVLQASKKSMLEKAEAAAVEMADFKLGKKARALQLNFSGEVKQKGSL